MSCKLLSGEFAEISQPMLWLSVGTLTEPGTESIQYLPGLASELPPKAETGPVVDEAQIEARVREAREAGRREGESAGRQAAQAELQPVLERLSNAIHQIAELRPRLRAQAEADVIRLAVGIARRVLHREMNIDPDALAGLVHAALEKIRLQETSRVRVHPAHQLVIQEFLARSAGGAGIEVAGDPALDRGGVVFETSRGEMDASIETQLREIERGLTDRIR